MISGQRLKVFHYVGEPNNEYCISEAPSLVDAHVDVFSRWFRDDIQDANRAQRLANVKNLHLSSCTFRILADAEELLPCLPLFLNLNHLEVSHYTLNIDCWALLTIHYNSPYLESICFAKGVYLSRDCARDGWQLDPVPSCFLTHLKTIKVKQFLLEESLLDKEINALKVIIKSAIVLESIELCRQTLNYFNYYL